MSYSVIVDNKVLDISYKNMSNSIGHFVYLGENYIGQIYKMKKYYSAVPKSPNRYAPLNGFKTRTDAMIFILKAEKIGDYG